MLNTLLLLPLPYGRSTLEETREKAKDDEENKKKKKTMKLSSGSYLSPCFYVIAQELYCVYSFLCAEFNDHRNIFPFRFFWTECRVWYTRRCIHVYRCCFFFFSILLLVLFKSCMWGDLTKFQCAAAADGAYK